jgi:hypothetical protein
LNFEVVGRDILFLLLDYLVIFVIVIVAALSLVALSYLGLLKLVLIFLIFHPFPIVVRALEQFISGFGVDFDLTVEFSQQFKLTFRGVLSRG